MKQLLDLDNLNMLKEIIGDDLNEILVSFIQLLPSQLIDIQDNINSANAINVRLHAHTIKGSASNVGASALAEIARRIENAAKINDLASADSEMSELHLCSDASINALQQFMSA